MFYCMRNRECGSGSEQLILGQSFRLKCHLSLYKLTGEKDRLKSCRGLGVVFIKVWRLKKKVSVEEQRVMYVVKLKIYKRG